MIILKKLKMRKNRKKVYFNINSIKLINTFLENKEKKTVEHKSWININPNVVSQIDVNTLFYFLNNINQKEALYDNRKIKVKVVGKIDIEINYNVIDDNYNRMLRYCEARPGRIIDKFIKPRTPWSYPISIWKSYYDIPYEGDSTEYLSEVFEHDFNRCQMNNFIKNEEMTNEIRKILRLNFRKM